MQLAQFEAHAGMEERHWWFLGRRLILQTLLHELLPPSPDRGRERPLLVPAERPLLIDVGSGTGGLTEFLSREYTVIGVEPTADGIEFSRKRFPHCTYIHGYAPQDVPQLREADAVLLIEVLEHVEKDVELVHALIDAMKPGAYLMMLAPADMSLWGPHDDAFEHFRRYDGIEGFRKLWSGTSVDELLVSHCMRRLYPVVKWMRRLSKLRGKSWGKGGTDIEIPMAPVNAFLRWFYSGEAKVLLRALRHEGKGYAKGVSVVGGLTKKMMLGRFANRPYQKAL